MQIKYYVEDIEPIATNTLPRQYKLHLTAEGDNSEIEWFKVQLENIGRNSFIKQTITKTNNKKENEDEKKFLENNIKDLKRIKETLRKLKD